MNYVLIIIRFNKVLLGYFPLSLCDPSEGLSNLASSLSGTCVFLHSSLHHAGDLEQGQVIVGGPESFSFFIMQSFGTTARFVVSTQHREG